jgi:hypothetical protein
MAKPTDIALPAQACVLRAQFRPVGDSDDVEHKMIEARVLVQRRDRRGIVQPDNQHVGFRDDFGDVATQELPDVRHMLLDEPAIRPEQVGCTSGS